jgi:hypothetical protein
MNYGGYRAGQLERSRQRWLATHTLIGTIRLCTASRLVVGAGLGILRSEPTAMSRKTKFDRLFTGHEVYKTALTNELVKLRIPPSRASEAVNVLWKDWGKKDAPHADNAQGDSQASQRLNTLSTRASRGRMRTGQCEGAANH